MSNKSFFKKLGSAICIIFFIALGIGLVGNISTKFDGVYNLIKFRSYVIVSNSMQPTIDPGDVIFIKKSNVEDLEVGDVITFQKENFIATHRIIEIQGENVITQGDNNNLQDDPLSKENIIGEYMFRVPKVGYIYSFVGSPIGMIVLGMIIALIIIYEFCFADDKNAKEKDEIKKAS